MYEIDAQVVLRCGGCNKPFNTESTLRRHGYYCRSRRDGSTARPHSCVLCAKAKARCDHQQPECSRCSKKGTQCHYPSKATKFKKQQQNITADKSTQYPAETPLLVASPSAGIRCHDTDLDFDFQLDITHKGSQLDVTNLGTGYFDSESDFLDLLSPDLYDINSHNPTSKLASSYSAQLSDQTNCSQEAIWMMGTSLQASPSSLVRSFNKRSNPNVSTKRITDLIFHNLRSYPLMIQQDNALPPFIHPHFLSLDIENNDMESINNCISLVQMINKKNVSNQKLFWKNVQMECERLHADHLTSNKEQLLANMQALSMYLLVRLSEGETDHNNIDALLIGTVIALATRFNGIIFDTDLTQNSHLDSHDQGLEAEWKEWIFEESTRRLCIIYQIVNMLVEFEPAAMCELYQPGLLLAPLPTKKQWWEADSQAVWKSERERDPEVSKMSFGLTTSGDLIRLNDGNTKCYGSGASWSPSFDSPQTYTASNKTHWEQWCAGIDGLGGLVMLAASLVT